MKELELYVLLKELVEGTEQKSAEMLVLRKNQRDPSPLHFIHNASVCHVRLLQWDSGRIRD